MAWKRFVFPIFLIICFSVTKTSAILFPNAKEASREDLELVSVPVVTSSISLRFGSDNTSVLIPKYCEKLGYCENVSKYPVELAEKLTQEIEEAKFILDNDYDVMESSSIQFRTSLAAYDNLCPVTNEFVVPRLVRDDNSMDWYYVLNTKKHPMQGFKVELCKGDARDSQMDIIQPSVILDDGYTPSCVQKYVYRKLIIMLDNSIQTITHKIPVHCTCVAYRKY